MRGAYHAAACSAGQRRLGRRRRRRDRWLGWRLRRRRSGLERFRPSVPQIYLRSRDSHRERDQHDGVAPETRARRRRAARAGRRSPSRFSASTAQRRGGQPAVTSSNAASIAAASLNRPAGFLLIARAITAETARRPRNPRPHLRQRRNRLREVRTDVALGGVGDERAPSGEQLEEQDAGRIDVGPGIRRPALHLFGRHVRRRSDHGPGARQIGRGCARSTPRGTSPFRSRGASRDRPGPAAPEGTRWRASDRGERFLCRERRRARATSGGQCPAPARAAAVLP